jgi:hypothetical protein
VGGTGLGSWSVVGFGVGGVELLELLISWGNML